MKKKFFGLIMVALLCAGCGKTIPKLANGEEAVVTFKNGDKISVDELYQEVKNSYALSSLVSMIDKYVLEKQFPDYIETANNYAGVYISAIKSSYENDTEWTKALNNAGIPSEEVYKDYLYLTSMQQHAALEYTKSEVVTEKEIKDYYKKNIVGDVEISHILVVPEVTDSMTEEEKKNAENSAKAEIQSYINELKDVNKDELETKFAEIAKEHSDDAATAANGGSLGRINKNSMSSTYKDLMTKAYEMKDGTVSTTIITTELGYHIIYKKASYEKATLDEAKDGIAETLANEKLNNDTTLGTKALQFYRKEQKMEIQDSELQKQYAAYIQNKLAASSN